jgi:hypothetical protein
MNTVTRLITCFALAIPFLLPVSAQNAPDPHSIPVVDGALGPCAADFTVNDTSAKPVYNAKVSVRVHYGRFHKLDLEVGTNVDGKARFAGLPTNPRRGLFFEATEGERTGNAFQDPSSNCKAQFTVTLRKSSTTPDSNPE